MTDRQDRPLGVPASEAEVEVKGGAEEAGIAERVAEEVGKDTSNNPLHYCQRTTFPAPSHRTAVRPTGGLAPPRSST